MLCCVIVCNLVSPEKPGTCCILPSNLYYNHLWDCENVVLKTTFGQSQTSSSIGVYIWRNGFTPCLHIKSNETKDIQQTNFEGFPAKTHNNLSGMDMLSAIWETFLARLFEEKSL